MKYLFYVMCLFQLFLNSAFSQTGDWLSDQKRMHSSFHSNFHTTDYICEATKVAKFVYDIKSNSWVEPNTTVSSAGKKELFRIIKSDDMRIPISLCEARDEPQSVDSKLNKYFCIINTHPKSDGWSRYLTSPDGVDATHYKCLLNIQQRPNEENVNTLICTGGLKFVLTFEKYFDNNFVIGPYSSYDKVLTQSMEAGDCKSINN